MSRIILVMLATMLSSQASAEVIIDIFSIAGKSKHEVSEVLGKPTSCGSSKYGEKCQFKKAETEIVFIKGKADWITVEGLDNYPFKNETLKEIGLKQSNPTFSNAFTKRWEYKQGLLSVSLFKGERNSDYAYIKVYTK